MIVTVNADKELGQIAVKGNQVVNTLDVWECDLRVPKHALKQYIFWLKRSKHDQSAIISLDLDDVMFNLRERLTSSYVAKHVKKDEENKRFRFFKGIIFVLRWSMRLKSWFLDTAFQCLKPRKRGFEIQPVKKNKLAQTWSPTYCI